MRLLFAITIVRARFSHTNIHLRFLLGTCWSKNHDMIIKSKTGEKLVNFLVEPKKGTKWPSNLPRFETRQDAISVCKELCKRQFLLRSEKRGKGELGVRVYFFLQWGLILLHGGEFLKIHLELPLIFFFFPDQSSSRFR